jgi:hypothetical protein
MDEKKYINKFIYLHTTRIDVNEKEIVIGIAALYYFISLLCAAFALLLLLSF